jgi:hypothetical protein
MPVHGIGPGIDEGNDLGSAIDAGEKHGAIHPMAFDIGTVVIGGGDPGLGLTHNGLSLFGCHRAMVGVGM